MTSDPQWEGFVTGGFSWQEPTTHHPHAGNHAGHKQFLIVCLDWFGF